MIPPAPDPPPSRRSRRRLVASAAVGIAVAALMMSGCVSIKSVTGVQRGSIGDIDLLFTGCGSKAATPGCELNRTNLESNATSLGQVLLALDIDARHVLPATFTTDANSGTQPFTLSPSYTAELTRLDPPDPGRKWVGYISDARTYVPGKEVQARIAIARPPLPDGSPAGRGFSLGWKIGSRAVEAPDLLATRPVTCGDSLSVVSPDLTICSDNARGETTDGFHDFGFLTPAPVTVQAGQTAAVAVAGKLAGSARPAINFALSATTTVPGAAALMNAATLAPPTDSTTTVTVSVAVPPGTPPGSYAVTLTGRLATGETRATTGSIVVAGPGPGPGPSGGGGGVASTSRLSDLGISRTSISNGRRAAPAVISVTLATPGRLRVVLERKLAGRKKNGRCVAPTPSLRRSGAGACSRFVVVSTFTRADLGVGVATVNISGRGRAPGSYRVSLTHIDAAGVASVPLRATLTIRR